MELFDYSYYVTVVAIAPVWNDLIIPISVTVVAIAPV